MLAVTSGRGNSVPEVIEYLRRAASADGTQPEGTIYYMQNSDRRRSRAMMRLRPRWRICRNWGSRQ